MKFESELQPPNKKGVVGKALLGATALASANSMQAEDLPRNYDPTHEVSESQVGSAVEVSQNVSKEAVTDARQDMEGVDPSEESEVVESEDGEEKWTNWKEEPTPASAIDSLNESERQSLKQNIERFRAYAKEDPEEHSASLIIRPDGTTKWFEQSILARESFSHEGSAGQLVFVEDTNAEIENEIAQGATRIRIHNHPTAVSEGVTTVEKVAKDLPPSPVDMFSLMNAPKSVVEGRVVTELGEWRYGFKNEEAKAAFTEAIETGAAELDRLSDPKLMLQLETLMEALAGKMHKENQPKELIDKIYQFSKNHEDLKEQVQSNYQFFASISFIASEYGPFTREEIEELGIQEVVELIKTVDFKRSEALEKIDGLPVTSSELLAPPSGPDNKHSSYVDQWQRLGVYIERVSPSK